MDATVGMDRMPPDTGSITDHLEGGNCVPGATDQGSCIDPTNVCVTWSPQGATAPVSTCVRPCEIAMDCANSAVGQVCGGVFAVRDNTARIIAQKACVSGTVGEGETANVSLSHAPTAMTGCADDFVPIPWFFGSALFELDDDQGSCARPCGADDDCNVPNAKGTKCVGGIFNSTVTPGLCQTRFAGKGARCSSTSAIEMCNTSSVAPGAANGSQNYICIDFGLNDTENTNGQVYGACFEVCRATADCETRADNAMHAIACETGVFNDPTLGLCDDNCNSFPDDCPGMGSPPKVGAELRGMTCQTLANQAGTIDLGFCIDVSQTLNPLLTPFDFQMGTIPQECDMDPLGCPDRAICLQVDQQGRTGCVYGCDSSTTAPGLNGCANTGFATCTLIAAPPGTEGVCTP
jgi:hypothetical protein